MGLQEDIKFIPLLSTDVMGVIKLRIFSFYSNNICKFADLVHTAVIKLPLYCYAIWSYTEIGDKHCVRVEDCSLCKLKFDLNISFGTEQNGDFSSYSFIIVMDIFH